VGVELDIIQLAPLSIYNFVAYDVLGEATATDEYDPENPPPSLVVLSMGTDTTDLVITNGFRVWQRSVPLGGNHFTKQLTKELKLTFAKAEHLKRNARQAEDPKLVFQAMRLVFNDLVTEVQRSIGYFQGIDRKAKIGGVVVLGNAVKLPGLQQYLGKNLGYEVNNFEAFSHLKGPSVLGAPAFKDNQLSFGVCYGLCLQGLGVAKLRTNLVPREIMTERLVRSKKPWVVASVAALLLACTFNVFFHYGRLHQVAEDRAVGGVDWKQAASKVDQASDLSSRYEKEDQDLLGQLNRITAIGEELVGNTDRRVLWLEMLKTVNSALPQTPGVQPGEIPDVDKIPFHQRQEIHVEQVEVQYFEKLEDWFTDIIKNKYADQQRSLGVETAAPAATDGSSSQGTTAEAGGAGPTGEGWVVQLRCYHYFNQDLAKQGISHVNATLIRNLKFGSVVMAVPVNKIRPGVVVSHAVQDAQGNVQYVNLRVTSNMPTIQQDPATGAETVGSYQLSLQGVENPISIPSNGPVPVVFTMQEMGIDYPVVFQDSQINPNHRVPNPNFELPESGFPGGSMGPGGPGMMGGMGPGMMGPSAMGDMGAGSRPGGGKPAGAGGNAGAPAKDADNNGDSQDGDKDKEPEEPPFLTVPRYDFVVQFIWKETLLSARLEKQATDWEKEKQKSGTSSGSADLASNSAGGA
jgi:type IV pilus assembly protein PilM